MQFDSGKLLMAWFNIKGTRSPLHQRVGFLLCAFLMLAWTCIPVTVNVAYSIQFGVTVYRLNILLTLLAIPVLILCCVFLRVRFHAYDALFILFTVYCFFDTIVLTFGMNIDVVSQLIEFLTIFFGSYLWFKVATALEDAKSQALFCLFVFVSVFVAAQLLFYGGFSGNASWGSATSDRGFTTVGYATASAMLLFSGMTVSFSQFKRFGSSVYLLTTLVIFAGILVSMTRASISMALLYFFIVALLSPLDSKVKFVICVTLIVILVVCSQPELVDNLAARFFTDNSSGSDAERELYRSIGLGAFSESPFFGKGAGVSFTSISHESIYIPELPNPHNQYIALLVESGLVGMVLLVASVVTLIVEERLIDGATFQYALGFLIVVLVGSLFEVYIMRDIRTSLTFWLPLAYLWTQAKRRHSIAGDKDGSH